MNNFDIIFLKAGEEWTTIAKTKGKKKTKPEDEWQEVDFFTSPMTCSAVLKSSKRRLRFFAANVFVHLYSLLGRYGLCFYVWSISSLYLAGLKTWDRCWFEACQ